MWGDEMVTTASKATANAEVVIRFIEEAFNSGNFQVLREIVDPEHVSHLPTGDHYGPEGVRIDIACFRSAFPDLHVDIDEVIPARDRVIYRFTAHGTHEAPFMGVPACHRRVSVTGIAIDRLRNGKTVERWVQYDSAGLLQQLGALPS